ncbi:MAG: glutamine synthetase family protein [Pseudomonadota bacterium]
MGERLRLLFCDHLNLPRGKYIPERKIGEGESRFCRSTFAVTYDKDLIPSPGSMMLEGLPDMIARFDRGNVRPGWEDDTNVVAASLFDAEGAPLPMCGRGALQRAIADWQGKGLSPKVGIELEAFAFRRDQNGQLAPYDTPSAFVYSTGIFADPDGFTDAIWETAEELGFRLEYLTTEYDSPEFEFTLSYDDALRAVDENFLFRVMIREIAWQHGIHLTFMPKPIPDLGGAGVHVNFSFADAQGANVLAMGAQGGPHHMTDLAKGCIAGLMRHHKGLAGLIAPTVNSYARLQPATLSGYWCNWGGDHRGVTTRISAEGGSKTRIEHRMADGAANIYTTVAAVLQAARLGVEGGYALPPMETGDCFETTDATEGVPESLGAALDALAEDSALTGAVGQLLCDNHIFMKRDEIEKTSALEGDGLRDFYIHWI